MRAGLVTRKEDGEEGQAGSLAGVVPSAVGAGATTLATLSGAPPEVLAAIGFGATQVTAALQPAFVRRFRAFMGPLLRPWEAVEDPEREFWDAVAEQEAAQEAVFVGISRLRNLLDPSVAASLGKLVAQYVEAGRKPDRFFRDASGVLVDVAPNELVELHRLLGFVSRTEVDRLRLEVQEGGGPIGISKVEGRVERTFSTLLEHERFTASRETVRLMRLLGRHGLAVEGSSSSGMWLELDGEDVRDLMAVLVLEAGDAQAAAGQP